jgi:tetratricopeptide (TPR) repeat protein
MGSIWGKLGLYIIVFVFALYMSANGYSPVLTVGLVMMAILFLFGLFYFYPLLLEKRIARLEVFLRKQSRSPAIYINYLLANRQDEEAKALMEQLMRKYKRPETGAPFKAAYGAYRKDTEAVREAVPYIRVPDYRAYYEVYVLAEEGKFHQARQLVPSIKKAWMRFALLAELERKEGRHEAAVDHAREAFRNARGVHRYVLYKEYERLLPQALEGVS